MSGFNEDIRRDHFKQKTDREFPDGFRLIDGTTPVARSELLSARERILATVTRAGGTPVVGGIAASILHNSRWFDHDFRIDLLRPPSGSNKQCSGRAPHRFALAESDVTQVDGVLVTTAIRTAFDVGRIRPAWRGLGHLDALHRATRFSLPAFYRYIEGHAGWRHIRQLRALAPLVNGDSESPPESGLRLLLIRGDLPTPDVQIEVYDECNVVFARMDLGYRTPKIGIEYDSDDFHSEPWERERDALRDTRLRKLGWHLIHVDSRRMRDDPCGILIEIEEALKRRGAY